MLGTVLATVFGLMVVRMMIWGAFRRRAWARHGGCGPGGGYGRRGRRGGPGSMSSEGFARAAGEVLKRRLGIDEEQEGIVDHALIDLRSAVKELVTELKDTRATVADAFRGETVDDAALSSAFSRHDDALGRARRQIVSALKQIHAVLTPKQREKAADWGGSGEVGFV